MENPVPRQIRGRYFSQRNPLAGGLAIGVSLLGGRSGFFREKDFAYDGYLALFLLTCNTGIAAFFFLVTNGLVAWAIEDPARIKF